MSVTSPAHEEVPDKVRVTLKVTPWHAFGLSRWSLTKLAMDSVPLVAPALTVMAGEMV